jgi:hypothetical protein
VISTPRLIVTLAVVAALGGCNAAPPSADSQHGHAEVSPFTRAISERGSVSFRSNNGKAYRSDGDTELTFYSNGEVCMLEYGFSGEAFWGNYHTHPDGCIVSWFRDYRSEWPVMFVEQDGSFLVLRPRYQPNGLMPMEPGDATRPAEQQYWRFRMLSGDDEKEVLQTVKQWSGRGPT